MASSAAATMGDRNHNNMRFTNNLLNNQAQQDHGFKFPAHTPLRSTVESPLSAPPDNRATLQRRFTTDSMRPTNLNWDNQAVFNRGQMDIAESLDLAPSMVGGFQRLQIEDPLDVEVCLLLQLPVQFFDAERYVDSCQNAEGLSTF